MTIKAIRADLKAARDDFGKDAGRWLRELATGHDFDCDSCFWEGGLSVFNDGKISRSTAPAIPFLLRLAVAGVHTVELIEMIGEIGGSTAGRDGRKPREAHAAALEALPGLLDLAGHGEPAVQRAAVAAAAAFGPAAAVLPALDRVAEASDDPVLQAELLRARLRLDPEGGALVAASLRDPAAAGPLQAMAVAVEIEAGAPWTPELHRALVASYPLYLEAGHRPAPGPLEAVVATLTERGAWQDACSVVEALLAVRRPREVRARAIRSAGNLCASFRPAASRLLPALLPLLRKRRSAAEAAELIARFGRDAAPAAGELAELVARSGEGDDARAQTAREALTVLVELGDPRAAALLARHLPGPPPATGRGRRRLRSNRRFVLAAVGEHGVDFDAELLTAIRVWMRTWQPDGDAFFDEGLRVGDWVTTPSESHNAALDLLRRWGAAAAPALPELLAVLPNHFLDAAPAVVAVVGTPQERADGERALRAALSGKGTAYHRREIASAIRTLSGDPGPLLVEAEAALAARDHDRFAGVEAVRELGEEARPLLPALREAAARAEKAGWEVGLRIVVSVEIWRLTGELGDLPELMRAALKRKASRGREEAVEAARELGPRAHWAAGALFRLLRTETWNTVPLAAALLSVCRDGDLPQGASLAYVSEKLLEEPGNLLTDLPLPAGPPLTSAARARLETLAHGERRITPRIGDDQRIEAAARALLAGH